MKLKINGQGLLLKSDSQIDRFMVESLEQLRKYSSPQLRVSQQDIYDDSIKAKTGEDIKVTPSKDPFIDVTGFSLKAFTLDRFKKHPSPIVMSATTDFAPLRYLKTAKPMAKMNYEAYYKEFKLKGKGAVKSNFRLPGGPLVLKNSPWKFYYGANDHILLDKGKIDMHLIYGLVFLDEEPVQLLMKMPEFESLYRLLTIIVNDFSHDFTGHGSIDFVIGGTPEVKIYIEKESKDLDVCTNLLSELCKYRIVDNTMAAKFDELRQLNLHMCLIEACIKRNENYLVEIAENARTFFDLLRTATEKIGGNLGVQVNKYFSQVYIFCAGRMLPTNYIPHVVGPLQVEMYADFIDENNFECNQNILSSSGNGLPVPKQGFGHGIASYSMDDIAYYMDHRTIFMNVYKELMK